MTRASLLLLLLAAITSRLQADEQRVDYLTQIKPLLAQKCYACHGALRQRSELRLDTAAAIRKGGAIGPAIEPKNSAGSLLIDAVTESNGMSRMPPEGEGEPLEEKEVALLKAWIDQGAAAPDDEQPQQDPRAHWSFRSPARPSVPVAAESSWIRNPVDAFIAAEHRRLGLVPVSPADRPTLLRRVFLDLTGLPPSREELHAFLADRSPDAYERIVDRLLESPAYGERWGRHWMDVWRYSDWYGNRGSNEIRYGQRHIWRWRDWIIESLNADKGYDRMLVEMLAGDEVAPGNPEVVRATGFLGRNWYKFNRNVWLQETVEQTSVAFLGETMKCTRCHDHKFDPITQEEYYRLRAFFEPHDFRIDPVPGGDADGLKAGLARVVDQHLDAPTYLFVRGDDRYPDKEHPLAPGVPALLDKTGFRIEPVALPLESYYPAMSSWALQDRIARARADRQAAVVAAAAAQQAAAALQAELDDFDDESPGGGAAETPVFLAEDFSKPRPEFWSTRRGRWDYAEGRLAQREITNFAMLVSAVEHPRDFKARLRYVTTAGGNFRSVGLSFDVVEEQAFQAVYTSANDNQPSVQAFHRQNGREEYPAAGIVPCTAVKVGEEITLEIEVRGTQLTISVNGTPKLNYQMSMPRRNGRLALWVHNGTAEFRELHLEALKPTKKDVESRRREALTKVALQEKKVELAGAELESLQARIAAEQANYATPAAADAETRALLAGKAERHALLVKAQLVTLEAEQQLATASAGEPPDAKAVDTAQKALATARAAEDAARLAASKEDPAYQPLGTVYPHTSSGRRLALARWMVRPENPRTARVAVNHIWLRHFGAGLVPTVANFGVSGQPPTHPELLDWLAVEFVESGWSMKHLHRLIVTSNTYRMASVNRSKSGNRQIDSENRYLWRMNSRRMEAEAVRDSVLSLAGRLDRRFGGPELDEALGQTERRRSLYFRVTPDNKMPFLALFDLANPNECYRRTESVIPQQSLAMTNSRLTLSSARLLTHRLSSDAALQNSTAFVAAAFEQILTRAPTSEEVEACERFLARHETLLRKTTGLAAFPAGPADEGAAPAADPAMRARENLVHILLSHNDFITIR